MKLLKYLTSLLLMFTPVLSMAQTANNYGFESGNYSEWTVSNGSTTPRTSWSSDGAGVQVTTGMQNYCPGGGKCWTVTPYGSYMVAVQAGGSSPTFDNAMTTLGLSGSTITSIKNTIYSNGNMMPTNASSISRTVYLQAGTTYTFAWQYLSTDYVPYNDGSMITVTGGPGTPTINGQTQNFALLGFTNPGTGNYSTDSYGATGWQVAVFTVPADGNYLLGFASFNLGDTALSPILFIDQLQGSTLLNGSSFTPIQPNEGSTAPPPPSPDPTYPVATITTTQQTKMNQVALGSTIYIDNYGDNNSVYIEQFSKNNVVRGINGNQAMYINGNNNSITINQGTISTIIGNNIAEVSITGSGNALGLTQQHALKYTELIVSGSSNQLSFQQNDTGQKAIFANIQGNSNIVTAVQEGTGNHFLDINAPFGTANITVNQAGSTSKQFQLVINNPGVGITINQTNPTTADSVKMDITCATGPCTGYTYTKN